MPFCTWKHISATVSLVMAMAFSHANADPGCECTVAHSPSASFAEATHSRPSVLLVGIGGWKSCLGLSAENQYISERFQALVHNIRRCRPGWDVHYAMYCSPGLKTARFDSPVRFAGPTGAGHVPEKHIGLKIGQQKPAAETKVFVLGHSHGGWMAMRAALSLGHVDGLFTMEPVSARLCATKDYLRIRTRKIFKRRQKTVPGCRTAPTDVDSLAVLHASAGNWTNFFLAPNTKKGDIYSSAIAVANNRMVWAPAKGRFNAHHNLGLSAEVWSEIEQNILGHLVPMVP